MTDVQQVALMEAVPRRLDAAVEVDALRKEFRRRDGKRRRGERRVRVALDSVSFAIEKGETVAILGQNGGARRPFDQRRENVTVMLALVSCCPGTIGVDPAPSAARSAYGRGVAAPPSTIAVI